MRALQLRRKKERDDAIAAAAAALEAKKRKAAEQQAKIAQENGLVLKVRAVCFRPCASCAVCVVSGVRAVFAVVCVACWRLGVVQCHIQIYRSLVAVSDDFAPLLAQVDVVVNPAQLVGTLPMPPTQGMQGMFEKGLRECLSCPSACLPWPSACLLLGFAGLHCTLTLMALRACGFRCRREQPRAGSAQDREVPFLSYSNNIERKHSPLFGVILQQIHGGLREPVARRQGQGRLCYRQPAQYRGSGES